MAKGVFVVAVADVAVADVGVAELDVVADAAEYAVASGLCVD